MMLSLFAFGSVKGNHEKEVKLEFHDFKFYGNMYFGSDHIKN